MEQAAAEMQWNMVIPEGTVLSGADREVLRRLATRVAGLAARPIEDEKRDLWFRHNALEATRPLIFCNPENGWNEIITPDQLECGGDLAREWEKRLRIDIFSGESMQDERVIEPYLEVPCVSGDTGWGMRETIVGGEGGGSYRWDAPLESYDDLEKLHFPSITVDREATRRFHSLALEAVGGELEVRSRPRWWWSLGMTWQLINLRGLEQVLLDMHDNPDGLHRLMALLRDGHLAKLDFLETSGLLSPNNDGSLVGSGGFGYTRELPQEGFDGTNVRARDMWGFCESQETSTVSPEMFEEFVFQYQLPVLERFGLNCYGCCEPLDRRWHVVEKAPRLRRVSVSPWSDIAAMAEKLGDRYIFSMKPNPAALAVSEIDEGYIRSGLREAVRATRDCRVEIIMKDNQTIGKNPQNVIRWCRIAREEAEAL